MKYLSIILSFAFVGIGLMRISNGETVMGCLFIIVGLGGGIYKIIQLKKAKENEDE
jgi:hypothetical protein